MQKASIRESASLEILRIGPSNLINLEILLMPLAASPIFSTVLSPQTVQIRMDASLLLTVEVV